MYGREKPASGVPCPGAVCLWEERERKRERERERERGREREGERERERGREQDKPSHVRGHIARYSSSSSGVTGEGTVDLTWLFAWFRFRENELKFHRSRRLRLEPSEPAVDRGGVILCRLFTYCLGL